MKTQELKYDEYVIFAFNKAQKITVNFIEKLGKVDDEIKMEIYEKMKWIILQDLLRKYEGDVSVVD